MIHSKPRSAARSRRLRACAGRCLTSSAHSIGTKVSETTAEITMVTASVTANSWNRRPTTSPMNSSGISTAISDTVSETMVKPICPAPFSAACMRLSPISMKRAMFSIMTMASSTTKPVAMVSDISDRLSSEKPHRYIPASVPTSEIGTDRLGISVAGRLRRNRKITSTTSATDSISSNSTSAIEARMVVVRSVSGVMRMPAGIEASRSGSTDFMSSTTPITLAPGWRCTLRMIAGLWLDQAASCVFSGPSTTLATSPRRIGAPF